MAPIKLWRYMSFSRFVWMLSRKSLWMCRADLLGDEWEMSLSKDEVQAAIDYIMRDAGIDQTAAQQRLSSQVREQRQRTFVNCWTAAKGESHAMWKRFD